MPDEQKLDLILERFYNRYNKFNTKVLKKFGEVIAKFDGLSPEEAAILANELRYSADINELFEYLDKINNKSSKDIEVFYEYVAIANVLKAKPLYVYRNIEFVGYKNEPTLVKKVEKIQKDTKKLFDTMKESSNIGFSLKDDKGNVTYKSLKQTYNKLVNEASINTSLGKKDYGSAMRGIMNQLADSGVKIHEEKIAYENGYNRRIDSALRQDVTNGVRRINMEAQKELGKKLGADGVQITAHSPCALDHLEYQGRQYTTNQYDENGNLIKEGEFEKINTDELSRPIAEGIYNCGHYQFPIIIGVNEPDYTDKQLQDFEDDTLREITYKGKTYNAYEATQVQRRLETAIRQQKDRQIIARAGKKQEEVLKAQQRITKLTNEYKNFSQAASLRTYMNRLTVTGYRRVKA